MSELKPCPFCGAEPEVLSDMRRTWGLVKHRDGCFFPNFRNHEIPEYDFEAWNTRHVETCHNTDDDPMYFCCSKCGSTCTVEYGDGGYGRPSFCPSCGRKVEG